MWDDTAMIAACKHPAWTRFHRQCGNRDAYFEIDTSSRQPDGTWRCNAVTFEKSARPNWWRSIELATGSGRDPIAAVLAAFDGARAAGADLPASLADGLRGTSPLTDPLDELLGAPSPQPDTDMLAELVG